MSNQYLFFGYKEIPRLLCFKLLYFLFQTSDYQIVFLVLAERVPNYLLLVDMGNELFPLNISIFLFEVYLIANTQILNDNFYAVFFWVAILLPCQFQACNRKSNFRVSIRLGSIISLSILYSCSTLMGVIFY